MTTQQLKYDWVTGGLTRWPLAMAASQKFVDRGGKFVDIASGYGTVVDANSSYIFGWAEVPGHASGYDYYTTSATAGAEELSVIISPDAVFKMPVAYDGSSYTVNYAYTVIGTAHDIYRDGTSYVQFADLTNSTDDLLIVLGGKAASAVAAVTGYTSDGYAYVRPNPAVMIAA